MTSMTTLRDAVMQERDRVANKKTLTADWRNEIPAGSRWRPGDVGKPNCPTCQGIGYVSANVPTNHPLFGTALVCDCQAEDAMMRVVTRLKGQSSLLPEDFALRWKALKNVQGQNDMRESVQRALARKWGWVYLYGDPGVGKSITLRTAIAESVLAQQPAIYARWDEILDHLRGGYGEKHNDYDDRLAMWQSVGILAIDEIGRARETDWAVEQAHKLLDHRYRDASYGKTVTLFASNFDPNGYDAALASRVNDNRFEVVRVVGMDMRTVVKESWPF